MNSDAKIANLWASQDSAAGELERVLKLARRFTSRQDIENILNAAENYASRLRAYLDAKESEVRV